MCEFFSFCGDGFGNYRYLDWEYRKNHFDKDCDSHTYILTEAKIPPKMQDRWSNYEYNPFTKKFKIDQEVGGHPHEDAEAWVSKLDFKTIVEPLILKEIISPFELKKRNPTLEDIEDFEKWISMEKLWVYLGKTVRQELIKKPIGTSIRDLVWSLIAESVGKEMRELIWKVIDIYLISFFDIDYSYDFSPLWRLWDHGFIPLYDEVTWKLLSGADKEIVYTKTLES